MFINASLRWHYPDQVLRVLKQTSVSALKGSPSAKLLNFNQKAAFNLEV